MVTLLGFLACLVVAEEMTPVTKVVHLLQDMGNQLQKDKEADEEAYEKMSCWCTSNEALKDEAVKVAADHITKLTTSIEARSAKAGNLKSSIDQLKKDIAAGKEALSEAASLRNKQNSEFTAEEADLMNSIKSLGDAIDVLSKHQTFLQIAQSESQNLESSLQQVLTSKHVLESQRRIISSLLQQPADFKSYNSRSGPIFGILSQMKETFEQDLARARGDEGEQLSSYTELKASKEQEVSAAQTLLNSQVTQLSDTEVALAGDKHDLADMRSKQSADMAFLTDLKLQCQNADAEYQDRTNKRLAEIAAVGDAIKILTDDSARDLFSSTLGNSFIQRSTAGNARRQAAAKVIQNAAYKTKSTALMSVAGKVRLDSFTKVKKAIDDMLAALAKEMKDEEKHNDFCISDFTENKKQQTQTEYDLDGLDKMIAIMKSDIDTLTTDIADLNNQVSEMSVQLKRASEDREAENKEFQQTVADQRATQTLLDKARARLAKVYLPSLVQQEPGAKVAPPPAPFKQYEQSAGSTGVVALLTKIMAEAHQLEVEALHAEQSAQKAYASFTQDTNRAMTSARKSIMDKTETKATTEVRLSQANTDHAASTDTLMKLQKYNMELHSSCDYVMNNFDARQTARREEMDSLQQAKAILSGAEFD